MTQRKTTKKTQTRTSSQTRKTTKKKKVSRATIIIWVCAILILAPFAFLAWVLISSALDTGTPVLGDRYKDDLDPAITKAEITQIESSVGNIGGVEKVTVELATATLRVYADITDDASQISAEDTASQIYNAVIGVLDPSTYFSQNSGQKMYDLEIHVYNLSKDRDSDSFVYVIETKTSSMDAPITQLVSEPIDADLAQQLRDAVEQRNNPTATPEATDDGNITVGGEEVEATPEATQ